MANGKILNIFQTQEGKNSRATLPLTVPSAGLSDWEPRPRVKHLMNGGTVLDTDINFHFPNNHQVSDDEGKQLKRKI